MKKVTEKDLSLDKQVVSELSSTDTKVKTNEVVCATKVCTDSHFEICCDISVDETCPEQCPEVKTVDICPVTNDTLCDDCSNIETCLCLTPETQDCTINHC